MFHKIHGFFLLSSKTLGCSLRFFNVKYDEISNIDRVYSLVTMEKLRLLDHTYYLLMSTHLKERSSFKTKM